MFMGKCSLGKPILIYKLEFTKQLSMTTRPISTSFHMPESVFSSSPYVMEVGIARILFQIIISHP